MNKHCIHGEGVAKWAVPYPGYGVMACKRCKDCSAIKNRAQYLSKTLHGNFRYWPKYLEAAADRFSRREDGRQPVTSVEAVTIESLDEACERCGAGTKSGQRVIFEAETETGPPVRSTRELCFVCHEKLESWWGAGSSRHKT